MIFKTSTFFFLLRKVTQSLCASFISGTERGGVYLTCTAMLKGEMTSDHSTDEE